MNDKTDFSRSPFRLSTKRRQKAIVGCHNKKPPLCKGRWAEERGSEGLFFGNFAVIYIYNPSVSRSYLASDSSPCTGEPYKKFVYTLNGLLSKSVFSPCQKCIAAPQPPLTRGLSAVRNEPLTGGEN